MEQIKTAKTKIVEAVKTSFGIEFDKFIHVNKILSYGIDGTDLHIHMDNIKASSEEKMELILDGLRKLVVVVNENPEVKTVSATSWIVARHHRSIAKLGFKIGGPISEEMKKKHFKREKRPVWWSEMSREEFLGMYS
ncbi:MAG TPA: hypothetical protein VJH06_01180 [Candidatus Paceibacterota bacterium]